MEHAYGVCLLARAGAAVNETNLVGVLEAANVAAERSRAKATVAALESVDVTETAAGRVEPDVAAATAATQSMADEAGDRANGDGTEPLDRPTDDRDEATADSTGGS